MKKSGKSKWDNWRSLMGISSLLGKEKISNGLWHGFFEDKKVLVYKFVSMKNFFLRSSKGDILIKECKKLPCRGQACTR